LLEDVIAFAAERATGVTLDVIDVSNCSAGGGTQSCYGSGVSNRSPSK
jgi:hypothetical protein